MIPRRAILPLILIVLAPTVMLYTLWGNPTSAGEDDVIYYYPLRKLVGQALREGRWPRVNHYEATGMPLMGDPQSAVMYPPTWLFAAGPAKRAYTLTLLLGFSLAGGGAYLYLRRVGLIRPAACFGAVAFMFCGFLVGHRVHWSVLHTGAWLPWGLWCIEGLGRRPGAALAWMVPVAFLTIAAGHWPTLIHVGLIWSAYLVLRARPLGRSIAVAVVALALAAALAGPQLDATRQVLAETTRHRIGYATAGENSFFPASAALALFPMLYGCRTPNFFPTDWWGPWHLCETLGYVGLVTLALAGGVLWKLHRRHPKPGRDEPSESVSPPPAGGMLASPGEGEFAAFRPLVRVWTWIALGAGVWMLGYYLPTYRLVHMLPVLGVVRCPARMVVAVDLALATLAAVGIHLVVMAGPCPSAKALKQDVRRAATRVLPAAMLATLALLAAAGGVSVAFFGGAIQFFDNPRAGYHALESVLPTNPAVWVQFALAAVTWAGVRLWLAAPRRRAYWLVGLVLVDLFFVTRFVDVPAGGSVVPDPDVSPAAEWLRARHKGDGVFYAVWGIGRTYHDRPAELLRPKTAHALGIRTINTYGPFQAPAHAQLLGFRIFGTNDDWAGLIRRNRLLSLYGVRYLLTARDDVRELIESVRAPTTPRRDDGDNLLSDDWWLDLCERVGPTLRLQTPVLWRWSIAKQPVALQPARVYRISLDARGPDEGAANYLRAEIHRHGWTLSWAEAEPLGLTVHAEQIGPQWRHFEWTFRMPEDLSGTFLFRLFTMSERPIEVRRVALRASDWDRPAGCAGRLAPGDRVYDLAAELPARAPGDKPVALYENKLVVPAGRRPSRRVVTPREIEAVRWPRGPQPTSRPVEFLPRVGLGVRAQPTRTLCLSTLPAAGLYLIVTIALAVRRRRAGRQMESELAFPGDGGRIE